MNSFELGLSVLSPASYIAGRDPRNVTSPNRFITVLLCLTSVASCIKIDNSLKWTEDVVVPDGRVITLVREQRFQNVASEDGTALVGAYSFEFVHPDTQEKIRWENQGEWKTLALFVHEKIVYLIVSAKFGGHMEAAGCPSPEYILYRYINGRWEQIPLLTIPVRYIVGNMIRDPKGTRDLLKRNKFKLDVEATKEGTEYKMGSRYIVDLTKTKAQEFRCKEHQRYSLK